jgi:hypothetical protein
MFEDPGSFGHEHIGGVDDFKVGKKVPDQFSRDPIKNESSSG